MKKELSCLTPEAINNRFLNSTKDFDKFFLEAVLKTPPWWQVWMDEQREKEIIDLMEKEGINRKNAEKKVRAKEKAEAKARDEHYNSPLGKAERRIQELERHLELIKEVIANPNYLDRYD